MPTPLGESCGAAEFEGLAIVETAFLINVVVDRRVDLPGADIAQHLARHGVSAETDHVQSDLNPGNMLLSRAADMGADLIVMDAYGYARLQDQSFRYYSGRSVIFIAPSIEPRRDG